MFARAHKHGHWPVNWLSTWLSKRLTLFQSINAALMMIYVAYNADKLLDLGHHEPLADMYSPEFYRATWVLAALDAGFWSAMWIQNKHIREICEVLFSAYYLLAPDRADEKVRKIRQCLTVKHLRTSWNKPNSSYLSFLSRFLRPRYMCYPPRLIHVPRPKDSSSNERVTAWLYFDGPTSQLKIQTKIVLDIPGGGFVATNPRCNDDRLMCWAGQLGLPILSLDYKKAPEYPYPYALNECFDVYRSISSALSHTLGFPESGCTHILLSGDSAGGNLATALTLKILEYNENTDEPAQLPVPAGLLLMYPSLDFTISSWMSDDEVELMQSKNMRRTTKNIVRRKSNYFDVLAANENCSRNGRSPKITSSAAKGISDAENNPTSQESDLEIIGTGNLDSQLAVCSLISFTNDRILTQEMMRTMIILYIGPNQRPDFKSDYLLSPLVAPDFLLARFPPTYIMTGERDPLVDNTVLFAGRLRQAREKYGFPDGENKGVAVHLIPGISHGFMQMVQVYPQAKSYFKKTANWIAKTLKSKGISVEDASPKTAEVNCIQGGSQWGMFKQTAISGEIFEIRARTPSHNSDEASDDTLHDDIGPTAQPIAEFPSPRALWSDQEKAHQNQSRCVAQVELNVTQYAPRGTVCLSPGDDLIGRRMKALLRGIQNN